LLRTNDAEGRYSKGVQRLGRYPQKYLRHSERGIFKRQKKPGEKEEIEKRHHWGKLSDANEKI